MDLSRWIERQAGFGPDRIAIRHEGRTLSYGDFAARIRDAGRVLKHHFGIGRGDRIAHLGANSPDLLVLLFACARLGAMLVPLNWRLATPEHRYILGNCQAKMLAVDPEFSDAAAQLSGELPGLQCLGLGFRGEGVPDFDALPATVEGDDHNPHVGDKTPILIVYTSGTTGRPKGAVLTQGAMVANAVMSKHVHDLREEDHILTVLPMFHVGGLNMQTVPGLLWGARITLHSRFDPGAVLKSIAEDRPTLTVLVPATLQAVSSHPNFSAVDISCLKSISTGSTTVPPTLMAPFSARGIPVLQVYGSTETCPIAVYQRPQHAAEKPHSTGRAGLLCEVRTVDGQGKPVPTGVAGEIQVRGPNVMVEYWGNEAATEAALTDGWFNTGDIGTFDADGDLVVHDRKKHMIISGGENIYPAEVERELIAHPGIAEASVIGRPHDRWGEVAVAVLVRKPGFDVTEEEILGGLDGKLARFKHPRKAVFVDRLPRNAMGKVVIGRVRDLLD